MQNLTADCPSNLTDNNEKDDEIEFEEREAGEMVPKRKNAGPWKVNEPEQPPPPPKGNFLFLPTKLKSYILRCKDKLRINSSLNISLPILFQGFVSKIFIWVLGFLCYMYLGV